MFDRAALAARLEALPKLVGTNASELCLRSGLTRAHLSLMVSRIRETLDHPRPAGVEIGTLAKLAHGADYSLGYIVGIGFRLRDLPGWSAALKEAQGRYPTVSPAAWAAAGEVHVPKAPARIDAAFVATIARALEDVGAAPP